MKIGIDTLSKKIGLGYLLMVFVLSAAVLIPIWLISNISNTTTRLNEQRIPTARVSLEVINGMHLSTSALRGWMLMQDSVFLDEKKKAWENDITISVQQLNELSQNWTNPENVARLNKIIPMLEQLKKYQDQIEEITLTDLESAQNILKKKTIPLFSQLRELLVAMSKNQEALMTTDSYFINNQIFLLGNLEWILLIAGVLISMVLGVFVTRSVTLPISEAVLVANNIAAGNFDTRVNVGGTKELEALGIALTEMRDSLKAKTKENERYNWLSKGQNKLNETLRGDKGTQVLANDILKFLADYTGASIGSLFLNENGSGDLKLNGGYALMNKDVIQQKYKIGEGLIGQVAINKEAVVLSDLDSKQLRLNSTLIDTDPKSVVVYPFLFENKTLGVIELGKLDDFDSTHREFLDLTMESIAISMNSALARNKIQQLLEETQQQSEELQSQQEELRLSNEELGEQTEKLKEQQEELQMTNEELEEQTQLIEEKNKNLETARTDIELKAKQLEISSKYKSEFLANMSHELRTPLNSLLILSNDLLQNNEENLNEDQVESARIITKSAYDLLNLINEILDLSKIEAGKMDLNVVEFNPKELANDINGNFKKIAQEKGVEFEIKVHNDLPATLKTDRSRLDQIIKNMLSNAIKFTEEGSVRVDLKCDAGNNLNIIVSDTGVGISVDKHAVIFEAFQQAEGGISRKYGGTGLGLSISRELARLLGGKITLESELGVGSTFTLIVPLVIAVDKKRKVASQIQTKEKSNGLKNIASSRFINYPTIEDQREDIKANDRTILIIEDDNTFARVLVSQAKEKGFKYLVAATGEDGIILTRKYLPAAIILDLNLPGINGHMVLNELKGDPELRHIPIHIISGNDKSLDPIKSGAIEFITKPVNKLQLDGAFSRIEDFVNRKMKNLLILEDDQNLRKGIVKLIGNGDVQCYEASTGKDAFLLIEQQHIDCLVLDIGLPDMTGFEFIKRLEKNKQYDIPPIIVYTGKELTKKENELLQEYAETVIIKGVKSEERLLDETALFLHRTVKDLPSSKRQMITGLYNKETIFQGKKILLVDDDMRNVFALSKVLKERGMQITKAENGLIALQVLEKHPEMDLVLMDIMMPEMDGYECTRKIRSQSGFKNLPIIALTAKAMKEDREICIEAGANDYITKPVDLDRLLSLMRVWINK